MSASAVKAGRAFVEVFAETNPLERGLKQAEYKLKRFGSSLKNIGGAMAGVGLSVGAAFVPAIKAASDLQETMSKFETVFGERSKEMKAWGDQLAETIGRSKGEIASFLANTQDLLVPVGFEPGAAEEMSKQITSLAFDLASFNNMQDADVVRDLHAALTGSGEVMKKYGVVVSEAAVKQELLNQGLDPKTVTEAQKAHARFAIILRGTTAAQGDAERTSGSFANQMKALDAKIKDTAATIGGALLPVVTPLVTQVAEVVKRMGAWINDNKAVAVTVAKMAAGLTVAGAGLYGLGIAANGAAAGLAALRTVTTALNGNLYAVGAAVAAAGIGILAYKAYQSTDAIRDLNAAIEENHRLTGKRDEGQDQRRKAVFDEAAAIDDPAKRADFLREQLDLAQKNAAGARASAEGLQKRAESPESSNWLVKNRFKVLDGVLGIDDADVSRWIGDKLPEDLRRQAADASHNADRAEDFASQIRDMLAATEREKNAPTVPTSAAGPTGDPLAMFRSVVGGFSDRLMQVGRDLDLLPQQMSVGDWLNDLVDGAFADPVMEQIAQGSRTAIDQSNQAAFVGDQSGADALYKAMRAVRENPVEKAVKEGNGISEKANVILQRLLDNGLVLGS